MRTTRSAQRHAARRAGHHQEPEGSMVRRRRLTVTSCQSARIATPSRSAGAAARSQPSAVLGNVASLIGRLSGAWPLGCSSEIAPSGGDVAGRSRVSMVMCRLRQIVPDRWRRFLYTKTPPPAESLDLQGGAQTPDAFHATARGDDDASTLFHPDCTVGPGFSPDLLRRKMASLAGLACYAPYRRSGIAPCPEGRFAGLRTRYSPGALFTPHWPLSHHDRVYSTLA